MKIKWKNSWKYFKLNLFEKTKFRIWIYISKFRQEKLHFCFSINNVISLDTAHIGKRICGRLNLTELFGKDFRVYSSSRNEEMQSQ